MQSVSFRIWTRVTESIFYDDAQRTKKIWNMKETVIPIIISTLGKVLKSFNRGLEELEIGGRIKPPKITALLRSSRILRIVLGPEETYYLSDNSKSLLANDGVKIHLQYHKITWCKVTTNLGTIGWERWLTGKWQVARVFANGPGDLASNLSRVIPKTFKMVLDTAFLNTQQY